MEEKTVFIINGGKRLSGEIPIMGAKNEVLKVMAAALLFRHPVTFSHVPNIEDVVTMQKLLESIGATIERKDNTLTVDPRKVYSFEPSIEMTQKMRASIILLGPLIARFKKAVLAHPGGCVIGKRPIDYFINGCKALGADMQEIGNESLLKYFFALKKNKGGEIFLPFPSVTATETFMLMASLAYGETIIKNAATEPEIISLAQFLVKGGVPIEGAGTNSIVVQGRKGKLLSLKKKELIPIIPDRIETGSFAILASLLGNRVRITHCQPAHVESLLLALERAGVEVKKGVDWIEITAPKKINALDITTGPYPSFATDLQAPFSVLLTQSRGQSVIFETIWENRLNHLDELTRMGAHVIVCDPHRAIIEGPTHLRGKEMSSPDLRAGLALVLAALIAKGQSIIHNIYHIDRGYERIEERLQTLGADIARINEPLLYKNDNSKIKNQKSKL